MRLDRGGGNMMDGDPAELAKFDALAHRFWDPRGEFRPLHVLNPLRAEFVADRAALRGVALLDVGCGGGLLAESLARHGARVTAIDLAPAMIEVARLHALESGIEVEYQVASAESLATRAPAAFAIVTCMEMLEHVPDPAHTVACLAQLVSPGGNLFVSTINRTAKAFALAIVGAEYVARLLPRGTHEYEKLIRPSELAGMARAAGLELRDVAGLEFDPLTEQCRLTRAPEVNYIAHFARPADAA